MKNTVEILIILMIFSLSSCNYKNDNSNNKSSIKQKEIYFTNVTELVGKSESGIADSYLDWEIKLFDEDSIVMYSLLKGDVDDICWSSFQYYGNVKKTETQTYEIIISKAVYIGGCDKPSLKYWDTDTIPFVIDSALLTDIDYYDLIIQEDTIRIEDVQFLYKISENDFKREFNKDIVIGIIPNKSSGLYPTTLNTGFRCGVYISQYEKIEIKYYLKEEQGKYDLMMDHTERRDMVNKRCNDCIKSYELEKK